MGKAGKERKRRRIEAAPVNDDEEEDGGDSDAGEEELAGEDISSAAQLLDYLYWDLKAAYASKELKPLRTALFPLIQQQAKAHFEIIPPKIRRTTPLEPREVVLLKRVAAHFASSDEGRAQFASPASRPFRRALHPFVVQGLGQNGQNQSQIQGLQQNPADGPHDEDRSFSGRISNAFHAHDWGAALRLLHEMSRSGEVLKLGALQRWVRDCDLALTVGEDKNVSLLLLDGTMRVGETNAAGAGAQGVKLPREDLFKIGASTPAIDTQCEVETFAPFCPTITPTKQQQQQREQEQSAPVFSIVHSVPGEERKPPSAFNLDIFATAPHTIDLSSGGGDNVVERRRFDVPGVPGAFVLTSIFSPAECQRLIHVAEALGFRPDAVDNIDNLIWFADETLLTPLFERCRPLLPQTMGPHVHLKGLNARMRLFRYYPGAVYRPHIDGAWPGSGLDAATGKYTDDAFTDAGDRRYSKLTFVAYLNDIKGAEGEDEGDMGGGGATTFFLPDRDKGFGHIQARGVVPLAGNVLCFPHGDVRGSLVHEGSEVAAGGVKYIIRTDVLYSVP